MKKIYKADAVTFDGTEEHHLERKALPSDSKPGVTSVWLNGKHYDLKVMEKKINSGEWITYR